MLIKHLSDWHVGEQIDAFLKDDKGTPDLILVSGDMVRNYIPRKERVTIPEKQKEEGLIQRRVWELQVEQIEAVYPGVDIVAVPGNHDFFDMEIPGHVQSFDKPEPKTIEIGGVKITGFRGVPIFRGNWDCELSPNALKAIYDLLDKDAHILLTHTPPEGVLDFVPDRWNDCIDQKGPDEVLGRHIGAKGLLGWVAGTTHGRTKIRLHAFGHCHEQGGKTDQHFSAIFSNGSLTTNYVEINV